jgi:hypothetical protein
MKGPFFAERDIVLSSDFLCCDAGYDESLRVRDLVLLDNQKPKNALQNYLFFTCCDA